MKICPRCQRQYEDSLDICDYDGVHLQVAPAPIAAPSSPNIPLNSPVATAATATPNSTPSNKASQKLDTLIGTTLEGRYHIISKLGQGGMGAVYKAEQVRMSRICAVKVIPEELATPDSLERFDREAKMSALINDPHAVTVYDFGATANGMYFLAMEYVEGETITSVLRREGILPLARVARIVQQCGEALTAAHRQNIIHRDLKPDNIMVSQKDGQDWVKILDFGIAKLSSEDQRYDLTKSGLVIGTPLYMSPEQVSGEKLDVRSDLYSLALIIYQMLVGALPFQGENAQSLMVKRITTDALPPRALNPQITLPPGVEAALMAALARERQFRIPTVQQFVEKFIQGLNTGNLKSGSLAPSGNLPLPRQGNYQLPTPPTPAGPIIPPTVPVSRPTPPATPQSTPAALSPPPTVPSPTPAITPAPVPLVPPPPRQTPPPVQISAPATVSNPPRPITAPNSPAIISGATPPAGPLSYSATAPAPIEKQSNKTLWAFVVFLVLILISTFGVLLSLSLFRKNRQPDPETNINIEQSRELNPPIASPPLPDPPNFDTNKELSQTINQTAQKALTALTNGDYAQAIALFRTVIALQPEHQSARQNLILALCLDQNPQEAITEIKLALENGVPISPKLQILLGFSNYQLEKYAEANEAFQAAYEQDKQRLELLAYTGFALQLTENTESATMQYQEFLRLLSERYHSHPAPQKLIALATLVQEILNGENTPPQSLQEWIIEDFTTWKEFLLENVEQ